MQLHFTGRNIEITPALKTFTQEKFERLTHRSQQITHVYITFHVDKLLHSAEATVHLIGAEIHAKADDVDMYSAIDKLTDKLLGQITKYKEKLTDHH